MWPYLEDDFMEMGNSGWVPVGEGCFINKYTGHTIDELGREHDKSGNIVFDPSNEEDNNI
jgi:hypothetical protein